MSMHDDQLDVSAGTVARLIAEQFPAWAELPLRAVESAATVNAIFRIGDALAARFPLRAADPGVVHDWLTAEAASAREFAGASPVPSPEPVAIGEPGHGYPLPWSVQTWLPGRDAVDDDPADSLTFADDLAKLLVCLRRADTRGRSFTRNGRGGHLPDHDAWMDECLANSEGLVDVPRLRAMWAELRTLPEVDADAMCHGDLTPTNVLVADGHLVGVLDTGGFGAADPALDLVSVWHLLDARPRQHVRDALGASETQWRRGMAWALQQAMGLVWYYATTNPVMSRWGKRTLDRLLASEAASPRPWPMPRADRGSGR
jgi:aminoglycoside phosphotransferase (APT) family kinase protein